MGVMDLYSKLKLKIAKQLAGKLDKFAVNADGERYLVAGVNNGSATQYGVVKSSQTETAGAGTVVLRNAVGNIRVAEPNGTTHAVPKSYADGRINGLTIALPSNAGNYHLKLVADPESATPYVLTWEADS